MDVHIELFMNFVGENPEIPKDMLCKLDMDVNIELYEFCEIKKTRR